MTLADRLAALERAQAEVINTANRLAILNSYLLQLELPRVNCYALGQTAEALEHAVFDAESEAHRRAILESVPA
jgi:hypothetical protein